MPPPEGRVKCEWRDKDKTQPEIRLGQCALAESWGFEHLF